MPTLIQTTQGRVTGLWGRASIRAADGKMHPLKLGDMVHRGDVILTSQDGIVRLSPDGSDLVMAAATKKPVAGDDIDRVINALNESDPQAATAAGLAGGDGAGDLTPGLRVDRITEGLTSASLPTRASDNDTRQPATHGGAIERPQEAPINLTAASNTIRSVEEGSGASLGLPAPGGASTHATIVVDHVPTIGLVVRADGTVVTAGTVLTPAGLTGLRYLPPADYNGTDPVGAFDYTVSDNGRSASGSVTVDLAPVNDLPVAADDAAITPINVPTTLTVLGNDSDRDGDPLTVTGATLANPAQGSVGVNPDGTLTFTPATNVSGPVAITYTISDGRGGSASATVTVTVGANSAPAGADAARTLPEDGSYVVASGDFGYADPDAGQTLAAVRIDSIPASGSLLLNGTAVSAGTLVSAAEIAAGHLVFVPATNASGAPYATFGFSVQDSAGAFDPTPNTISFSVTPVNDPPVAHDDLAATPIDMPATIAVLANDGDVDGDPLSVTGATLADPTLGSVGVNADGTLAFTPAANVSGDVVIHYSVADPSGATSTATLTVHVGPNTPPEGADATVTLAEDSTRSFAPADFGFSDLDAGQALANVRIDTLPAAGTLTFNGSPVVAGQVIAASDLAQLVFTPAPDANGTGYAAFSFSVQDSAGAFDTAPNTITIDVTPVADPAAISGTGNGATVEDTVLTTSGKLDITDPDAGEAGFVAQTHVAGAHGTFSIDAAGHWTYTLNNADPAVQALGQGQALPNEVFTVRSIDNTTVDVTVAILGTNDTPVAVQDGAALAASSTLTADAANGVLANDTDVDTGDTKAVSAISFGATPGTVGSALVGTYGTLTLHADGSYSYQATQPAAGSLTQGQTATDSFSYTMVDAAGASSTSTLTFTVTGVNDAPAATPDVATVIEDTPLLVPAGSASGLLQNDHDADSGATLSITQFTLAGDPTVYAPGSAAIIAGVGTLTINADGSYGFTPAADYNGPVPVATYTVSDGTLSDTATLTLSVAPANDPPLLQLDADHSHNTVAVQPIAGLFNTGEDASGAALPNSVLDTHYTLVSAPAGSTAAVTANSLSGAWVANDADSAWIGSTSNQPTGIYQYQTSFTLQAGADPNSVHIAFDIATDNNLRDILVNGVSTGISSNRQYSAFTHIELDGGSAAFGDGTNTITFVVDNRDPGSPTSSGPTGLRIDNITGSVAVIAGDATTHLTDYATIYVEGTPVSIGDDDVLIQDIDSPLLQSATITLTNPQAGDVLALGALPAGVTASVDAAGTQITLSGAASLLDYENAIKAIQFDNTSEAPSGAVDRLVTVVVNDGYADSNTATTTVHVVPVNDSPSLDLDGNDSTAAGTGYTGTYVEYGSGVAIVDADAALTDVDSAVLQGATIHITNVQPGDVLIAGALPPGISAAVYDPATGTLTLSGSASLADYRSALQGITFWNPRGDLSGVTRTIQIAVGDGSSDSNVAMSTIHVVTVNDAPTALPDTATANEDTTLTVAGNSTSGLLFNDTDVDTGTTLTVTQFSVAGDATIYGAGSIATIAGVGALRIGSDGSYTYTPAANYSGSVPTATYTVSDGQATSSSTLNITVTPVVDVPTLSSVAGSNWSAYTEDWQDRNVTAGSMTWTGNRAIEAGQNGDPAQSAYSAVQNPHSSATPSTNIVMESESYGAGSNVFSSTVNFATAGQVVEIGFDAIRRTAGLVSGADANAQSFTVEWNGTVIGTYNPSGSTWTQADLQVTSLAGDNTLTLRATETSGTLGSLIDNISVKTIGDAAINTTAKLASLVGVATFGDSVDHSERHTLAIDTIPVGATLSDGTHSFTATAGSTSATVFNADDPSSATGGSNWDLAHLTLTPPSNFVGTVPLTLTATATELSSGETAVTHSDLPVTFVPTLTASNTGTIGAENNLNGTNSNDRIVGLDGNDGLNGNNGNDMLDGGLGNDSLSGGNGNDVLIGGKGNDTLTGGNGADVFKWSLADQGTTASPAADTLADFDNSATGDKIDLRDLLVGEHSDAGNLSSFLHFSYNAGTNTTTISISSSGAFNGSNYTSAADQTIALTGVNLTTPGTDAQIINDLLTRNKLVVDH